MPLSRRNRAILSPEGATENAGEANAGVAAMERQSNTKGSSTTRRQSSVLLMLLLL